MGSPTGKALPRLPRPACLASPSAHCSPFFSLTEPTLSCCDFPPQGPPSACNVQTFKAQFKWHLPADFPPTAVSVSVPVCTGFPRCPLHSQLCVVGLLCPCWYPLPDVKNPMTVSVPGKALLRVGEGECTGRGRAEREVLDSRGKRSRVSVAPPPLLPTQRRAQPSASLLVLSIYKNQCSPS